MFTFLSPAKTIILKHPDFIEAATYFASRNNQKELTKEELSTFSDKLFQIDKNAAHLFFFDLFMTFYARDKPFPKNLVSLIDLTKIKTEHNRKIFFEHLISRDAFTEAIQYLNTPGLKKLTEDSLNELKIKAFKTLEPDFIEAVLGKFKKPNNRYSDENFHALKDALEYRSTTRWANEPLRPEVRIWCADFFQKFYETTYLFKKNWAVDYYKNHFASNLENHLFSNLLLFNPDYFFNTVLPNNLDVDMDFIIQNLAQNCDTKSFKENFEKIETHHPNLTSQTNFKSLLDIAAENKNYDMIKYFFSLPDIGDSLLLSLGNHIVNYKIEVLDVFLEHMKPELTNPICARIVNKALNDSNLPLYELCLKYNLHNDNHEYQSLFHAFNNYYHNPSEERKTFLQTFLHKENDLPFILISEKKGLIPLNADMIKYIQVLIEQKELNSNFYLNTNDSDSAEFNINNIKKTKFKI